MSMPTRLLLVNGKLKMEDGSSVTKYLRSVQRDWKQEVSMVNLLEHNTTVKMEYYAEYGILILTA